jgi:hypothetical protein
LRAPVEDRNPGCALKAAMCGTVQTADAVSHLRQQRATQVQALVGVVVPVVLVAPPQRHQQQPVDHVPEEVRLQRTRQVALSERLRPAKRGVPLPDTAC